LGLSAPCHEDGAASLSSYEQRQQQRIEIILSKMTHFFASMVDTTTSTTTCENETNRQYRFYDKCLPPTCERLHETHHNNAIRDLAAAWDATKILQFWKDHSITCAERSDEMEGLRKAISTTLEYYCQDSNPPLPLPVGVVETTSTTTSHGKMLHPDLFPSINNNEPPNIGHSALFLLSSVGAVRLSLLPPAGIILDSMNALTQGILAVQQSGESNYEGAFRTEFVLPSQRPQSSSESDAVAVLKMIDFYPGEAMVALMDMYQHDSSATTSTSTSSTSLLDSDTRRRILPSMKAALAYYSDYYVTQRPNVNYNIWQIQAFARFFRALIIIDDNHADNDETKHGNDHDTVLLRQNIQTYIVPMCCDIVHSKSWKYELARGRPFYPNLQTIEIACGLDALVDGMQVVMTMTDSDDDDNNNNEQQQQQLALFWKHADHALDFLEWSLDQAPTDTTIIGSGGLGYGGVQVLEQRWDVTGHAISALTKLHRLYSTATRY